MFMSISKHMIISIRTTFVWFVDLEFYEFIAFVSWVWNLLVWTQVSFSDHNLSMSVIVVVVVNFSHFLLLLHNHWTNFNQTSHKVSLGEGNSSFEGPNPFPREDNYDIVKIHWRILEIFFSRTIGPILTKLGTKHPCVKGIKGC